MFNFCDFIQIYVFTTNHHLNTGSFALCVFFFFFLLKGRNVPFFTVYRFIML